MRLTSRDTRPEARGRACVNQPGIRVGLTPAAFGEPTHDYADQVFLESRAVIELGESAQRGQRFSPIRERELDPALRSLALRLPGADQGLVLAPEFRGARGVVDLLAVTRVGGSFAARIASGIPFVTSEADSALLARLSPRLTRTPEPLGNTLGTSQRQTVSRLRALARTGAAQHIGGGYRRVDGLDPIGRAYALEAKVDDWRKGLSQAFRYASWADAVGVVLLERPSDIQAVKSQFRAMRIGLAIGDSWLVRPVIGRPDPGRRLALSEQLASTIASIRRQPRR